jgi:translation elongation factor EF-G
MAFQDAATRANPVLLEPIMRVEVMVPRDYRAEVRTDLASRRGLVQSQEDRGGTQIIRASVPLSEMLGYETDLRSRTRGLATFSMLLDRYQRVMRPPPDPDAPVRQPLNRGPEGRNSAAATAEPASERALRAIGRSAKTGRGGSDEGKYPHRV